MTRTHRIRRLPIGMSPARARAAGFTLVEIMVAMALGLLIILALVTMLINTNRNNTQLSKTSRMLENGRMALQLLEADVSHAGFWGGFVPQFDDLTYSGTPTDVVTAIPDPCTAFSTANWTQTFKNQVIGLPVQVYSLGNPVNSPAISGVCTSILANAAVSNDVMFTRHAEPCPAGVGSCSAFTAGNLYFQPSKCTTDTSTYVFGTDTTSLTLKKRDCTTTAERFKYASNLYYVRNYAATVGDGIPTLVRSQYALASGTVNHQAADALVENVDGFRVILGVDSLSDSGAAVNQSAPITWADPTNLTSPTNRGDGIPDGEFVRCTSGTPCTATQFMNTVAVHIYVLIREEAPTAGYTDTKTYYMGPSTNGTVITKGPFNDGYKRHLFTQTVRLVNVAMRRETP